MRALVETHVVVNGLRVGRGFWAEHAGVFSKSLAAAILLAFTTRDDVSDTFCFECCEPRDQRLAIHDGHNLHENPIRGNINLARPI